MGRYEKLSSTDKSARMELSPIKMKSDSVCAVCLKPFEIIKQMYQGSVITIDVYEHADCKEYWEHLHFHKPQHYRTKRSCSWGIDEIRWSIGMTAMVWSIVIGFEFATSWIMPNLIYIGIALNFVYSFITIWITSGLPRFAKEQIPITFKHDYKTSTKEARKQ